MSDFESRARRAADAVHQGIEDKTPDLEGGLKRARRSPARAAIPATIAVAAFIAGVLVALPNNSDNKNVPFGGSGTPYALAGSLKSFDQCDSVLQYFKDNAPDHLLKNSGRVYATTAEGDVATAAAPAPSAAAAPQESNGKSAPISSPAYSTTNVQEVGVDEPDVVKTDGTRIVAVANGQVRLLDANGGQPKLRATLPDTNVRNVFLSGDRVLVFTGNASYTPMGQSQWGGGDTDMSLYNIADMGSPALVSKLTIQGQVLDARMVGTQVRVATSSQPDVDAPSPTYGPNGKIDQKSIDALNTAISGSNVDDWIPKFTLHNAAGVEIGKGRLVECDRLARPESFSGLDTVAMTSFDISSSLDNAKSLGVIAGGQTVYATANTLYVTTTDWQDDGSPAAKTSLHKFSTDSDGNSSYKGSGSVSGTLLNEYSMSEYKDVLRVATTFTESRGWIHPRQITEGTVTTLREQNGELKQVGKVGNLGRQDNESIKAVRFDGDRGYVVTFRQTDPLYVLDLTDAANPVVKGELKIPGYSGYLHPIGDNLVLGVGQDAPVVRPMLDDPTAGISAPNSKIAPAPIPTSNGVQFSLFDVSDPAAPKRVGQQTYGAGNAGAEYDPKAFLYWEPRHLVIAPASLYGNENFSGVLLLKVGGGELTDAGRIAFDNSYLRDVSRSFIIGDNVYMLGSSGLQVNNLDSKRQVGKVTF